VINKEREKEEYAQKEAATLFLRLTTYDKYAL
jgi:hypothetical protein